MTLRRATVAGRLSQAACCLRIACRILKGVLAFSAGTCFADEALRGVQIAATCTSCHLEFASETGIPSIAGLNEQDIVDALLAYRASETPSHVMHAVALALSEEELRVVAQSIATLGQNTP